MIKAVIFDLDGTLVNSLNDLAISTNYALTQHGFKPHPVDAYKYFVGDGMAKLIERTIPKDSLNDQIFKSVFDCFMAYYRENFLENTVAYDEINDLLAELLNMGLKLAVVSNKADSMAKKVVAEIFGDDIFSIVIGKTKFWQVVCSDCCFIIIHNTSNRSILFNVIINNYIRYCCVVLASNRSIIDCKCCIIT